jgi:fructokinase
MILHLRIVPMSILVIGEALIDIVSTPGAPDRYAPGGAPANVALGLGRLGVEVEFLTDVGDDFHGGFLLAHLQKSQVAVLASPRGATSTALARLADDGSAEYEFHLRWDPDSSPLKEAPRSVVHFGSIAAFLSPGSAVIDDVLASATGASGTHPRPLISFDPNIRPSIIGSRDDALPRFEELARRVDVLKLSDVDANWLYPDLDETAQVDRLLSLGANLVAMTRGGAGAIVATASARASVTSRKVEVKDTIGAGDTFMVSLIHDLHAQENAVSDLSTAQLAALGDRASALAAITVSREGADLPWAADLTN